MGIAAVYRLGTAPRAAGVLGVVIDVVARSTVWRPRARPPADLPAPKQTPVPVAPGPPPAKKTPHAVPPPAPAPPEEPPPS